MSFAPLKRDAAPTAEVYLQNVVDDMDPEAQIEETYKSKNKNQALPRVADGSN